MAEVPHRHGKQRTSAHAARQELKRSYGVVMERAIQRQRLGAATVAASAEAARRRADVDVHATDSEDEPVVLRVGPTCKDAQQAVPAPPTTAAAAAAATTGATATDDTMAANPALQPIRRSLTDLLSDAAPAHEETDVQEPVSRRTRSRQRAAAKACLSLSQPTHSAASGAWMADSQEY